MKILLIVYAINYIVLIIEALGLFVVAHKLNVDFEDVFERYAKHSPFPSYPKRIALVILCFLFDALVFSPLMEHFTHVLIACEIYNLHHEKESA